MSRNLARLAVFLLLLLIAGCLNPFAPGFDQTLGPQNSLLGDQTTIEGVFQNFRYSYTFRDTTIYSQLLDREFSFVYRDYDQGFDVSWGRDEDMRTTYGLFQNVQNLDLVWNDIISFSGDSLKSNVTRGFDLTVTFNPNDVTRVYGYANLTLERNNLGGIWKISQWRDESNF
jgi:hypothetical protein